MEQANKSSSKLSSNLLQMKFMKRTKERVEIDAANEEQAAMFGHEITSEMRKKGNRFVFEQSFDAVENLLFGRMAFRDMNPEIEKLMAKERATLTDERDVREEEMAAHFGVLRNAIGRKFATTRSHQEAEGAHAMNKVKTENWH